MSMILRCYILVYVRSHLWSITPSLGEWPLKPEAAEDFFSLTDTDLSCTESYFCVIHSENTYIDYSAPNLIAKVYSVLTEGSSEGKNECFYIFILTLGT